MVSDVEIGCKEILIGRIYKESFLKKMGFGINS